MSEAADQVIEQRWFWAVICTALSVLFFGQLVIGLRIDDGNAEYRRLTGKERPAAFLSFDTSHAADVVAAAEI